MPDIVYQPHKFQQSFHLSKARIRGAFSGRRGGKTNAGAVETLIHAEQKRGYKENDIDPYLGVVIAPTNDMLKRLSIKMVLAYGKGMIKNHNLSSNEITFHNGSVLYGISADKPQRLEGVKANFIWMDEVFQMDEQIFLEAMARVSDTQGFIVCTGSLGTQYKNPKNHWVFQRFKERPLEGSECFEWTTSQNPYFPKQELDRLKDTLDPRTFRQMFELDWSVSGDALVYDDFSEINEGRGLYNPKLPVTVSIDWGWTHPMACIFFQHDRSTGRINAIDEIVQSKLNIEELYRRILSKPYSIESWVCDIAGNQEREQTGKSNIAWFRERGIEFRYRSTKVQYGLQIVRSFIKNAKGVSRFFVDSVTCPKLLDNIKNYSYPQKNGLIVDENPVKENDDAVDAMRYYFVNKHDPSAVSQPVQLIPR